MRPRLIVDCGSRIVSALIVTAEGHLLPCSQEVRQTAMRHVPAEIAFHRRVIEHADFAWDDTLEAVAKAQPHQFFQRARRIGLRRPWDADLTAEAVQLASPLAVLSSAAALADPLAAPALSAAAVAMLDALLDPIFAFAAGRGLPGSGADAVAILPANAGSRARLAVQKVFRRRGFAGAAIVSRETAAAMALTGTPATECTVWDVSDEGLHVFRVALECDGTEQRFITAASTSTRSLSRSEWMHRMAAEMRRDAEARSLPPPTPASLDRAVTAFLTGTPQPASWRINRPLVDAILGEDWRAQQSAEIAARLSGSGTAPPFLAIGDLCAIDPIRRVLLDAAGVSECAPVCDVPVLDRLVRGVATATLWQREAPARRVTVQPSGTLRINTLRNEAAEVLSREQLPRPGENCHVRAEFALRGDRDAGPFLVHLLWGTDGSPEGNATLGAMRVDRGEVRRASERDGVLRLAAYLRRSRSGRRLTGIVDAHGGAGVPVRSCFTHEFPPFPPCRA